jgi:hypothetical protein
MENGNVVGTLCKPTQHNTTVILRSVLSYTILVCAPPNVRSEQQIARRANVAKESKHFSNS